MKTSHRKGVFFAIIAFVSWGFVPLYWHVLDHIDTIELTGHRALWSFVMCLSITLLSGQGKTLYAYFKQPKVLLYSLVSGAMLGWNWFLFVEAIQQEKVLEASFGYYINPMLSVILGILIFKESLSTITRIAVGIGLVGILYRCFSFGDFPWHALLLAITFALYGAVKKKSPAQGFPALTVEFFFLALVSLPHHALFISEGTHLFLSGDVGLSLLLVGTGAVTLWPLYFFMKSTKLTSLSNIGFAIVWLAVGIYSYGHFKKHHKTKNVEIS